MTNAERRRRYAQRCVGCGRPGETLFKLPSDDTAAPGVPVCRECLADGAFTSWLDEQIAAALVAAGWEKNIDPVTGKERFRPPPKALTP